MGLIELEDQSWFPGLLRDQQLGYIGWIVQFIDLYAPLRSLMPLWLREASASNLFDLCSGSGEPLNSLSSALPRELHIDLSDKFPNRSFKSDYINYITQSVDVLGMEISSDRYYTMFNAFHHFDDQEQHNIVNSMMMSNTSFCFVEILEPSIFALVKIVFTTTIGQLVLAPFVRPFTWKRLFFTYIIPINLITITYDGIVSVLKSKNKSQYQTLLDGMSKEGYQIKISRERAPLFNHLIIIRGFPTP